MTAVQVERLEFTFTASAAPFQYERAGQNVHGWPRGVQVVDVVAHDVGETDEIVWLIEAKDYRKITKPPQPSKLAKLAETVKQKVEGTLASLPVVAETSHDDDARAHATKSRGVARRRVVLHLEPYPPGGPHDALFRGLEGSVLQKLRQILRDIDRDPLVLNIDRTPRARVPWTVR